MCIRDARGLTLVELVVAIAVVAIGVTGVLLAYVMSVRGSSDSLAQKQALAIAEAVLEEIQLMPYTYCDPDDAVAETATAPEGCNTPQGIGPQPGETRTGTVTPFDNVGDYHGYDSTAEAPPGIKDIVGTIIAGLEGYRVDVHIVAQALPAAGALPAVPANASLLVQVSVTGPAQTRVTLHGYRARYAPNALP